MPTYIERHPSSDPAVEVIRQLRADDSATGGPTDVAIAGWYLDEDALYCVLYADDPAAVQAHHASRGLACGEVVEVSPDRVERSGPLDELPSVADAISRYWPNR